MEEQNPNNPSEDLQGAQQEQPVVKNKGGRPKGVKNKPKRGRPKGSGKKRPVGRPPVFKKDGKVIKIPTVRQFKKKEKKEEIVGSQNLEVLPVKKLKASKATDEDVLNAFLDDEKFTEAGYNTSTQKIINQEPIDPSYYYRGSKNIPVAGAQYEFTADMVSELMKCKEDIIYFAENFFYIITLDRGKEKIQLYEKQKKVLQTFVREKSVAVCSSRQIGKSTMLTIFSLWMVCFNNDYRVAIVANKETTAINIFKRLRLAYEQLPNYIKPGVRDYGKTGMTLGNDSSIVVSTTTATSIRGESLNCITGDAKVTILRRDSVIEELTIDELYKLCPLNNCQNFKILTKSGWSKFIGVNKSLSKLPILTFFAEHLKLSCTSDHLLFENERETKQAKNFKVGDFVYTEQGKKQITKISKSNKARYVYDVLETEDHSFFANNICVHNCVLLDEAAYIECLSPNTEILLKNKENEKFKETIETLFEML